MSARKRKQRQNRAQQISAQRTWRSVDARINCLIYIRARRWYK
jgi:hypothetical protein